MKMKSIAKVSLVLGILATGVNTVTEQPVHAENKHVQVSQNSKNLKRTILNRVLNIKCDRLYQ